MTPIIIIVLFFAIIFFLIAIGILIFDKTNKAYLYSRNMRASLFLKKNEKQKVILAINLVNISCRISSIVGCILLAKFCFNIVILILMLLIIIFFNLYLPILILRMIVLIKRFFKY